MRFQEEQAREEPEEGAQGGERPRSEWRPDQVAVAEGAKKQRLEEEDADKRESNSTGGSSGSERQTTANRDDEEEEEGRSPEALTIPDGPSQKEREEPIDAGISR